MTAARPAAFRDGPRVRGPGGNQGGAPWVGIPGAAAGPSEGARLGALAEVDPSADVAARCP